MSLYWVMDSIARYALRFANVGNAPTAPRVALNLRTVQPAPREHKAAHALVGRAQVEHLDAAQLRVALALFVPQFDRDLVRALAQCRDKLDAIVPAVAPDVRPRLSAEVRAVEAHGSLSGCMSQFAQVTLEAEGAGLTPK
jgi:hypothetical protein